MERFVSGSRGHSCSPRLIANLLGSLDASFFPPLPGPPSVVSPRSHESGQPPFQESNKEERPAAGQSPTGAKAEQSLESSRLRSARGGAAGGGFPLSSSRDAGK